MVKRICVAVGVLLCSLVILSHTQAQSPFDDLQRAYDQYSQGKFKAAAETFDLYFKTLTPTAKDYYFAAICHAQSGNAATAVALADQAAYGIETYAMMLADDQLKPIHPEVRKRYEALERFYRWFNNRMGMRNEVFVRTLDSLYWSLPARRLTAFDYPSLASHLQTKLTDTTRAVQLIRDAIASMNVQSGEVYRINGGKVIERMARAFPPSLEPRVQAIIRNYNFRAYMGGVPPLDDFKSITILLQEALTWRGEETAEILTQRQLKDYFRSTEGQALLRYWISMNVIPAILASDEVFPYAVKEYSESQRLQYEYLQSQKFNTLVPRNFDVYRANATGQGKQYTVPRFQSGDSPARKDWHVSLTFENQILIPDKASSKEQLVLLKKGSAGFAERTGDYSSQPVTNQDFINRVKAGQYKYYTIASIQEKHLRPLTGARILARLKTNIESDDETYFFALETNMQWLATALPEVVRQVPAADRLEVMEFIRWYHFEHTRLVDYTVSVMTASDHYENVSVSAKSDFRRIVSGLPELLPDVFSECPVYQPALKADDDYYAASDSLFITKVQQRGGRIASAWVEFKKKNPYALPAFVPSTKTVLNEVTDKSNDFFMENGKPVFVDPYDHRLFKDGKIFYVNGGGSSAARYTEFVKDLPGVKPAMNSNARDEIVEVESVAAVEEGVMADEMPESRSKPLLKGSSFGGTAYVFTPSHHTNANELLPLKASEDEVNELIRLSGSLNLNPNEYVKTRTGFNIYYDRFYAFNAFGKIAVFCHDQNIIFSGYLDQSDVLKNRSQLFHGPVTGICKDNQSSYTEKVFCLNTLQVEPIGDRLAVMASVSVSSEPYCSSSQYCRVMVKLLDKNLNVVKERTIPGLDESPVKFHSNTDIKLVVKGDRIFAFVVPDCCGPAPLHLMVFDNELNVITPLTEITNTTGQIAMLIPPLALTTRGEDLVMAYPVNRNNDILLELRKVNKHGVASTPAYAAKIEGVIISNAMTSGKTGLTYHYVEKEGDRYFFKTLEIPWSAINKLK